MEPTPLCLPLTLPTPSPARSSARQTSPPPLELSELLVGYSPDEDEERPDPAVQTITKRFRIYPQPHSLRHTKAPDISGGSSLADLERLEPSSSLRVRTVPGLGGDEKPHGLTFAEAYQQQGLAAKVNTEVVTSGNSKCRIDRYVRKRIPIAKRARRCGRQAWVHIDTGLDLAQVEMPTSGRPIWGPNGEFLGLEGSREASLVYGASV